GSGPILGASPGTLASFSSAPRPPASTTVLGSPGTAPAPPSPWVGAPFGSQAVSASIIEPAFKPVALPGSAPAKFSKTEMLGSATPAMPSAGPPAMPSLGPPAMPSAGPPGMPSSGPPAMPSSGPPAMPTSVVGPHPALPARMEAPPMLAQVAIEARLPGPGANVHPQPPRTIANAETLATPQLPAHFAMPAMPAMPATPATPATPAMSS